jgi:elongation factor Ts
LQSGKAEEMVDKIVQGKMLKAMADSVLLEQEFIRDGSKKVKDVLPSGFAIKGFVRYAV